MKALALLEGLGVRTVGDRQGDGRVPRVVPPEVRPADLLPAFFHVCDVKLDGQAVAYAHRRGLVSR